MPPRTLSERSPVSVMRWDDSSTISSVEMKPNNSKGIPPLSSKSVRFTEENEILEIPHLDDIPDSDVEAIWYSAKEYSDIKSSYQLTIFMMESGEKISKEDTEHTTRGLEYRTQEGAWARYENKRDAYNAVLDEQDRQWKVDKDDFDKLREIYLEHSTKCAQAAVVRALQDEQDIKEYMANALAKPRRKKKKIIVVKKKKKKTSSSCESDSDMEGNATDSSNKSSRSTKSVSKKKAKEITAKLKRRAAASGADKSTAILNERSSLARSQFEARVKKTPACS
ncbi:hypothetical protein ACA910_017199 [Epithemia clementina (nom. ined.)]